MNYFHNLSGRRLAEALATLGFTVEVSTLRECPQGEYDCCFLSNITESLFSSSIDEADGLERIRALGNRCQVVFSLSLDCVSTRWYHLIRENSARTRVGLILDLGLHSQVQFLQPEDRANYRFVFSGLTPSEARQLELLDEDDAERTIPWAFVGHMTPHRVALVDHLVQSVDPRGFVYMPAMAPYTETEEISPSESAAVRAGPGPDPVPGLVLAPSVLLHGTGAVPFLAPDRGGASQGR